MREVVELDWLFPDETKAIEAEAAFVAAMNASTTNKRARRLTQLIAELSRDDAGIEKVQRDGRVVTLEFLTRSENEGQPQKEIANVARSLGGKPFSEGDLELEAGRARIASLRDAGVRAFLVKAVLTGVGVLVDDPEQKGSWTANLELPHPPTVEVEGIFEIAFSDEPRHFEGAIAKNLLRLVEVPGEAPRLPTGSVVVLLEEKDLGLLSRLHALRDSIPAPAPEVREELPPRAPSSAPRVLPRPTDTRWLPSPRDGLLARTKPDARRAAEAALASFIERARAAGLLEGVADEAIERALWIDTQSSHADTGVDGPSKLAMLVVSLDKRAQPELPLSANSVERAAWVRAALARGGIDAETRGSERTYDVVATVGSRAFTVPEVGHLLKKDAVIEGLNAIAVALDRPTRFVWIEIDSLSGRLLAFLGPEDQRTFKSLGIKARKS